MGRKAVVVTDEMVVDSILDQRQSNGKIEYYVRWKSSGNYITCWTTSSNFKYSELPIRNVKVEPESISDHEVDGLDCRQSVNQENGELIEEMDSTPPLSNLTPESEVSSPMDVEIQQHRTMMSVEDSSSITAGAQEALLIKINELQRKNALLKAENSRLEKLNGTLSELNILWQKKFGNCQCNVRTTRGSRSTSIDPVTSTSEIIGSDITLDEKQVAQISLHLTPLNKVRFTTALIGIMFTRKELASATATKLDVRKVTFMLDYIKQATGSPITIRELRRQINKKIYNVRQTMKNNKKRFIRKRNW